MEESILRMTKDEKSLLLFLEDCAVNKSGRVNTQHMNRDDLAIADRWNDEGFVVFARILSACVTEGGSMCVHLGDEAHRLAAELRKGRAERLWADREYKYI